MEKLVLLKYRHAISVAAFLRTEENERVAERMAAFNILSPSTTTTTFYSLSSCLSNITRTNYFSNDCNNNKTFSRDFHFSLFSSQTNSSSSSSSSKTKRELSKMPIRSSKSGSFPGFLSFSFLHLILQYCTLPY